MLAYVDPVEGFRGWLAFCGRSHRLAAGGLRVQSGLDGRTVAALAATMARKERLLGLAVDGAKAGIDYDPAHPGKREALRRFLRFLRPHLETRLSLGPDLGTQWAEIEGIAREEGMLSVKMAAARAQGLAPGDFRARLRVLDEIVDGRTVGQRRAGHALAHASLAALGEAAAGAVGVPVGIQGFGTLGRAAAQSLYCAGARVVALADADGCLLAREGLDVPSLLATPHGRPITSCPTPSGALVARRDALFGEPVDILLLAACEDALSEALAAALDASVVAVGANLGLSAASEEVLHRRGIAVVPDFVAGCGGSASMDALFGPPSPPTGPALLDHVGLRMRTLVSDIQERSVLSAIPARQAALALCDERPACSGPPYGR